MEQDTSLEYIRRRLFTNSALMFICRVTTLVVSMITVPLVVSKLGIGGFGIWETILAVSAVSMIFSNVIRTTLLWRISAAYGEGSHEETSRLVRLGVFSSLLLLLLLVPIVFLLSYPLMNLLHVAQQHQAAMAWILPGIVGLMILGGVNETMGAALSGYQRAGITTLIQSASLILNYCVMIIGLVLGWGLWSLLWGFSTGFLFSGIAFFWKANAVCGKISLWPALPTTADLRSMGPYSGFLLVGQFSSALRDQADRLILGAFASQELVGYYGIALRLASMVSLVCTFFYYPCTAATGALNSAGDWNGVRRLYYNIITLLALCGGVIAVLLGAVWDRVVVFWMGHPIPEVGTIFFVILFGYTAAVFLTGAGTSLCLGVGRADIDTGYTVFGLCMNVILKVLLIATLGALGSVVASSLSWFLASLLLIYLMHRHLDLPFQATRGALAALASAIAVVALTRIVLLWFPTPVQSWPAFFSGVVWGTAALALYLLLLLACGVVKRHMLQNTLGQFLLYWRKTPPNEIPV